MSRVRTLRPALHIPRPAAPWLVITVTAVIGIAVRALIPPVIRWNNAHDDFAQVSIAAALLRGEWLGEWGSQGISHITLAKGPGYPLFLAAIHGTGIPPQIAVYLVYLAGALLVAYTTGRWLERWWQVVVFGVLAFNPVAFQAGLSLVYRDALITALALVAVGLGLDIAHRITHAGTHRWRWPLLMLEVLALAATLGLANITRSDILWIIVGTAGVIVVNVVPHLRSLGYGGWAAVAVTTAVVTLGVVAVPAVVAEINERRYGVHLVDDYSEGAFPEAVTLWSSIQVPDSAHYQNVSRAQRTAVYEASPTAALLADVLEVPDSTWIVRNCTWHQEEAAPCDDYGSYFTWALRDAAVQAGNITTAAQFQEFFNRLADDIQTACDSGELSCGMRGLSADVPPLNQMPVRVAVGNLIGMINGGFTFAGADSPLQAGPPEGSDTDTWLSTVNGSDIVLAAMAAGQSADAFGQRSIGTSLSLIYGFVMIPVLLLSIVALLLRRTWRSLIGWTAVTLICAWLGNLAIVAVFYAGTNRAPGARMPLYTMASESFLLVGLALACSIVLHEAWNRFATWIRVHRSCTRDDAA